MGKEGTPRGDTTTNLRNFFANIFLVPTKKLKKPTLGRLGRKHDKYRARKPLQLFRKFENHEHRLELDPNLTFRAENQAF